MTVDRTLLGRLRSRGEEVFTQISGELTSNPRFMKAMEGALRGKEKLEDAAGRAVRSMNLPTRSEFKRALARIESLEREVATLRAKAGSGERTRRAKGGSGGGFGRRTGAASGARRGGARKTSRTG